mgnify:CR=1 FL=1
MEGNTMKKLIVAASAVASIGLAGNASAQDMGVSVFNPYVDFEYTTRPDSGWWDGDTTSVISVGAEANLPWGFGADASVFVMNDTDVVGHGAVAGGGADDSAFDLGGFDIGGADVTISYELDNGMILYSTTVFDGDFDRESTSLGLRWNF